MSSMLTTSWMDEATKIVNKLLSKKESEFLRDPVDWQALGLHDYPAIIKTPMDLKTVKKKLEMESYRDPTRVAADIRLIFLNAMTYNAPGSRIYSQAKNLSEFFESNCKGLFKNVEDVDKPANAEEMGAWVDKCHRISAVELKRILDFLDTNYPSCLVKRLDSNEVEVNVDLITGRAFRQTTDMIHQTLPDVALSLKNRNAATTANPTK